MTKPKFNFSQKIRWVRLLIKGLYSSFEKNTANAILQMSEANNPVILDVGANMVFSLKRLPGPAVSPSLLFLLNRLPMFLKF